MSDTVSQVRAAGDHAGIAIPDCEVDLAARQLEVLIGAEAIVAAWLAAQSARPE